MLPIRFARIYYPDGSYFEVPRDGVWAQAVDRCVACGTVGAVNAAVQVVTYHRVPEPGKLERITVDGGHSNGDIYVWRGEETGPEYEGIKMGLWMDAEGYYRIADLASRRTLPEV